MSLKPIPPADVQKVRAVLPFMQLMILELPHEIMKVDVVESLIVVSVNVGETGGIPEVKIPSGRNIDEVVNICACERLIRPSKAQRARAMTFTTRGVSFRRNIHVGLSTRRNDIARPGVSDEDLKDDGSPCDVVISAFLDAEPQRLLLGHEGYLAVDQMS